jgi:hypothetical protein
LFLLAGLAVLVAAGTAWAAIVVRGTGTVTAAAYQEQGLQVSDERLSETLVPGGSADLVFRVRNPNAFSVVVNRIGLASALRKASPAGCTSKLSGPLVRPGGYRLPATRQVTVGAGARVTVTVPDAVRLAASARGGCGFVVDIEVQGEQTAGAAPTSAAPSAVGPDPDGGQSVSPTETPTSVPVTTTPPPPPPGDEDEDGVGVGDE